MADGSFCQCRCVSVSVSVSSEAGATHRGFERCTTLHLRQNPHQAGFICSRAQLQHAISSRCLQTEQQPHWMFPVRHVMLWCGIRLLRPHGRVVMQAIDNVASEVFYRCGWQKVAPIACMAQSFMLHHMPNKYVHLSGISNEFQPLESPNPSRFDRYPLTSTQLLRWLAWGCPA